MTRTKRGRSLSGTRMPWLVLAAVLVVAAIAGVSAPAVASAPRPKAVIIVGPSGLDRANKQDAARIASQANAAGMRVVSIVTPHATWKRVVRALQGASVVVYLGHGNGFPGPNGSDEDTHDGFGLNRRDGARLPVDYRGADQLRKRVRLATNAVVMLYHLCYASGNGEEYMGPEFRTSVAVPRVDNFASGFLRIGARAVFAYGSDQDINLPKALMHTNDTMDRIFKSRSGTALLAYDGFVGRRDYYRDSKRVSWARLHLDPHPTRGHLRALTGDLGMRASEFRSGAGTRYQPPPPDRTPPKLSIRRSDGADIAGDTVTLTPNGDHSGDVLRVRRTLSESAKVRMEVRTPGGRLVRAMTWDARRGTGIVSWDGRDADHHVVRDGRYVITLTARDRAGNRSSVVRFPAVVLTALRRVSRSASALNAADRDGASRSLRVGYSLTRRARVRIQVRDAQGQVVRTGVSRIQAKGRRGWTWDGRDGSGAFVPSGQYSIMVEATTSVGTMHVDRPVYVGAYRIRVSDLTPARGQKLHIMVDPTERQKSAPVIVLTQAGGTERRLRTSADAHGGYQVTVRLRAGGSSGTLRIRVVGRDDRGHRETQDRVLPLH